MSANRKILTVSENRVPYCSEESVSGLGSIRGYRGRCDWHGRFCGGDRGSGAKRSLFIEDLWVFIYTQVNASSNLVA
jgi:hypothetical protein